MTDTKPPPAPLSAPASVDLAAGPPPAAVAAALIETSFPLVPLEAGAIPPAFAKAVDPNGPAPNRMMAARAMAPIPPKALVPIIYALMMDPDAKVAAAAHKTWMTLDEKLVGPALAEPLPPQVLEALAHVLVDRFNLLERVLLNKSTPDSAFVWVAQHAADAKVINVVVENQERLLRTNQIVRGLKKNSKVLRSDLDKAIDFMVREGVFLDDVQEFEDAFLRLGKSEMLAVLKNVKVTEEHLSERERQKAKELGMSADDFMSSGSEVLTDEEREAMLDELTDDEAEGEDWAKMPFMKLPIPIQIKMAMTGPHDKALEGLLSSNRVVAGSAIRNPKIKENDVIKIARSKTMHEDVIRYICNNGDWTKSYAIKFSLIQNPKTPPSLVARWLPLMRGSDLKGLSKSKQVPSSVQMQAKRLLGTRDG
ncbi:MAG: hypothetical protein Q8O67_27410 [Deltaproteobacteria bacterium]|nr:hypothetical protein [Deltaproteobacteria bacterium]